MDIKKRTERFVDYVPDFEYMGVVNRDLPDAEQVVVQVHGLTYREQQRYADQLKMTGKGGRKGYKFNTTEVNMKMFINNVGEVKNLTVEGKAITDAKLLYEEGPPELIEDVMQAIQDLSRLEEGDIKNLRA